MNHKEKIQRAFNRAATSYDACSYPQAKIAARLLELIRPYHAPYSRVIDLGCGTGRITQQLAEEITPFQELHAIDIAESLLEIAKHRLAQPNIKIYPADFDSLPADLPKYDLIFSNMALHWSDDLLSTLTALTKRLTPQGILVFSIPLAGTFQELAAHPYYSCRDFINADVIKNKIIELQCFSEIIIEKIVPNFNDALDTLHSIKNVGATYVEQRKHKGLVGKSLLSQTTLNTLTYNIGYFLLRPVLFT